MSGFQVIDASGNQKQAVSASLSEVTITTTGTIDDLDFSNADVLRMNNASDATIRGLKAGVDGQRLRIVSVGAGHVFVAHQDTNSGAANRLINFATSGKTPLAAGVGSATYVYDATTGRWRLTSHTQGKAIGVTYASGNFLIAGGTWTVDSGDQTLFSYYLRGRLLLVEVQLDTTSVANGGGAGLLTIAAPGGYTPVSNFYRSLPFLGDNSTSATAGFLRIRTANGTQIEVGRADGAAFAASTNNTYVRGDLEYEVT